VTAPRLLDLFCCEGGAGTGYARAGFDVFGVDTSRAAVARYPFPAAVADAIEYVKLHGHEYDAIHASPPCQRYSIATKGSGKQGNHPDLIEPVRVALQATGKPYVIENVKGAPLLTPMTLCGTMFDLTATDTDGTPLRLERHRLFESNVMLYAPDECRHDRSIAVAGVYGGGRSDRAEAKYVRRGGYTPAKSVRAELIGADWMTLHGLSQSIPPAYTEWIGQQLMEAL